MVDVQKKLDEIVTVVESARSMPMSASCVVNRAELLTMLQEVRDALPESLARAGDVLAEREKVVAEARSEAERIVASAHAERGSLVSDTQVARRSQEQADRILEQAEHRAAEVKAEADEYVDSKLANFEVVLTKTIAAVDRGREKLLGRGPGVDEHGRTDADAPERSTDPEELRRLADSYVDTKLASFEAVLDGTLQAVGRGRQKLLGGRPSDELAQFSADAPGASVHPGQSDADYVAALASPAPPQEAPAAPQQPGYDAYGYGYGQSYPPAGYPDGGEAGRAAASQQPGYAPTGYGDGYGREGYAGQEGYGQDGYGQDGYAQDGYGQGGYPQTPESEVGYGWQQNGGYQPVPAPGDPGRPGEQPGRHAPAAQQGEGGARQDGAGAAGPGRNAGGLDETSLFDTSMIDVERLRELDPGR